MILLKEQEEEPRGNLIFHFELGNCLGNSPLQLGSSKTFTSLSVYFLFPPCFNVAKYSDANTSCAAECVFWYGTWFSMCWESLYSKKGTKKVSGQSVLVTEIVPSFCIADS